MLINNQRMAVWIGEPKRKIIQNHNYCAEYPREPSEYSQYKSRADKRKPPFIHEVYERKQRRVCEPMVEIGKCFCSLEIPRCGPARVENLRGTRVEKKPPHAHTEEKQSNFRAVVHGTLIIPSAVGPPKIDFLPEQKTTRGGNEATP